MQKLIPLARLILAVCLAATTAACANQEPQDPEEPVRLLALGDSYTIGEGVPVEERWPIQLIELLRAQGLTVAPPQIIAATGWTTSDLESAIERADMAPPYDLVTLLIGVNDQYRGWGADRYQDGFARLLHEAIDLAGGDAKRVIVLSIPDYGVTPFGRHRDPQAIRAAIDRFNEINRTLTQGVGARYVDITPLSREAADDPSLLAGDGLHPSGEMYARWARLALSVALAAVRDEGV